jgi:phenylalanyl-tRNA synthetase beta chain
VRRARAGDGLVPLDGVARRLGDDDLVIADPSVAVAIAGVMGGRDSEVSETTTDLLLESAFFAPAAVRRTSRRLGLLSQASYRFERRVDPATVPDALDAVAALIARIAGGTVAPGIVEDAPGAATLAPPTVRFRPRRATTRLGVSVPRAEMLRRLRLLGMELRTDKDAVLVTPPSYRGDVAGEEDLIEEVARLGGYDSIPATLPEAPTRAVVEPPSRRLARTVRRLLVAEGLSETVTLTFTDAESNALVPGYVGRDLRPLAVRNPLASELGELRRSPLVGLVRALRQNLAQGAGYLGLFEVGKGYGLDAAGAPHEPRTVSALLCGHWPPRGIEREGPAIEFVDLRGVAENLLAGLGASGLRWRPATDVGFLHPGKAATVEGPDGPLGVAGALHPRCVQVLDLPKEVWVFELDFQTLPAYGPARFGVRPLPRFPAVTRDIAVVVDEVFLAEAILEEVRALGDPRIETARLFDCYRGEPIPPGKKSLAYTLAYRAPDRTLTDDEVNALHARVRERLQARFALELRS